MTTLIIPNTFQNRTGTAPLKDLDENFDYIINNLGTVVGAGAILDGGNPTTTYVAGSPNIDCGGVT
jgi:hypothetical protein